MREIWMDKKGDRVDLATAGVECEEQSEMRKQEGMDPSIRRNLNMKKYRRYLSALPGPKSGSYRKIFQRN